MKRLMLAIEIILLLLLTFHAFPAQSQNGITVTQDELVSDFPDKLTFRLEANSSAVIQTITLLYRTNAATCQPAVAQQEVDFTTGVSVEAEWEWDFTLSGVLPPGAEIFWQWDITDEAGNNLLTEEQSYLVNDPRHTWRQLTSGQLYLQWYQGSSSFGNDLLGIATQSLERLANEAGVSPTAQIWITIYPTVDELREVDIHTTEWAGGISYVEYNSTVMAIGTSDMTWASSVIPHELAHLVTESVMFNCRGMWLPTWLSEGLAVYAEGTFTEYYTETVINALKNGDLPPLRTLESGFSSVSSEANLSYAHSGLVVAYMIDLYGAEKMADLLATIKGGQKIDKALLVVYGKDTDGIEADWRISLGYAPQPTQVPTSSSRTAVPTLALWTSAVRRSATPTASPVPSSTPVIPTDTPAPVLSPTAISITPTTGTMGGSKPGLTGTTAIIIASLVILIIAFIFVFIVLKKRRMNP